MRKYKSNMTKKDRSRKVKKIKSNGERKRGEDGGWNEVGYLEGAAQLKKTKRYCCLVTQRLNGGPLSSSSFSLTQIHTRGRGDASVGTKVFPPCKLKPLITNWEERKGRGWRGGSRKEMEGRKRVREM